MINEKGILEAKSIGTVVITAYTQDGCSESLEIEVLMTLQDALLTLGGMTAVGAGGVIGVVTLIKGKRRHRKK